MAQHLAAFTVVGLLAATAQAGTGISVDVVATGLNNPRGLGFAPNGNLYVAEAGSGGTGACRPAPDDPASTVCYGETGALTHVDTEGRLPPWRVLTGLPSMAAPGGFAASSGPVDVDFQGSTGFVVIGWGGDPALRSGLGPRSSLFGTLLVMMPSGMSFPVSDIAAGAPAGSDPASVLALRNRRVVADAGANALITAGSAGFLRPEPGRVFAALPPATVEAKAGPTAMATGPDGDIYVGHRTDAPALPSSSTIYRVPRQGGEPVPYVTGLAAVADLAFDREGTLYILEGTRDGRLLRKPKDGPVEVVVDGLVDPAGIAVGRGGTVYLSHYGSDPKRGEVLRLRFSRSGADTGTVTLGKR